MKKILWRFVDSNSKSYEIGYIVDEKLGCIAIEDCPCEKPRNYWPKEQIEIKGYLK